MRIDEPRRRGGAITGPGTVFGRSFPTTRSLLIDDLLGIGGPAATMPAISPDERRRRLTTLFVAASLAQTEPTVYVIEDAHWIDEVSESMLAEFFAVIPQTPSLVLITYRPEYRAR